MVLRSKCGRSWDRGALGITGWKVSEFLLTRSFITQVKERFLGYRTARRFGEVEGHELRLSSNEGF